MISSRFAGGLLISRSLAVLVTMTLATSMAAREGSIAMAGHQICLQVWLAVSLLTDALALAGQVCNKPSYLRTVHSSSEGALKFSIIIPFLCHLWVI